MTDGAPSGYWNAFTEVAGVHAFGGCHLSAVLVYTITAMV